MSGNMAAFNAITQKFETTEGLGETFAASVRTAGIGALTSFLAAELAESLNVNTGSFGGALFSGGYPAAHDNMPWTEQAAAA